MAKKAIKKTESSETTSPSKPSTEKYTVAELQKIKEKRRAAYEAKRNPEREERAKKVETLAAQMKKRGIDVDSIKDPGVIRQVGRLVISKEGKPSVSMKPRSTGMKFKSLVGRVLKAAHSVLTGSHLNVTGKKSVTGQAKKATVPTGATIKRYKTKEDFEKKS